MRAAATFLLLAAFVTAQDLAPRAYVLSPKGTSILTLSTAFSSGDLTFDPALPVKDASANIQAPVLSAYHSFSLFGRSANVLGSFPYLHGSFEGTIQGAPIQTSRSGLADFRIRAAANLYGGRAMTLPEFAKYAEKTTLGASLTVIAPAGQYDPARLVNIGSNRWSLKPELGFSHRWGRWAIDLYGGAWFFFANDRYYPGQRKRTQSPVPNGEAHVGYYVTPRLWVSYDANFWNGGQTSIDGVGNTDRQRNSRMGGTVSLPFRKNQAFKFAYSRGAYVTIGADYNTVTVGWQYTWLKR